MSDEYVDPNGGKAMQPGVVFPGMMEGGVVPEQSSAEGEPEKAPEKKAKKKS